MPRKDPPRYLARLKRLARARGGVLLSRAYVNDTTKLRFRCAAGHEWMQSPGGVRQGKWCARCGRARTAALRKAPAIARLRRIVARGGGAILSPEYVNSQTKLRFRCGAGHEWQAVPGSILSGTWCPTCADAARARHHRKRAQRVFRRLRRIVERKRGRILPPGFVHSKVPLAIRCARGHTWRTLAQSVDEGAWCPRCRAESRLAQMRTIADRWSGVCLSTACPSYREPLRWRCRLGHRFDASGELIKNGSWCPTCRRPAAHDIEFMRRTARERGGRCVSRAYVNSGTNLRWRCREGHEWEAAPARVIQGSWCPVCDRGWGRSRVRLSIEIMREMAAERGGECLSNSYNGIYDRLRWRCARGHAWITVANNVRRGGWCPVCAHSARGTLDGMRALACERGGRCLTRTWTDHSQALHFECARGHRLHLRANVAKSGVWCRQCGA